MDIRQLTIFVEAARARNFRAAALQLGIAQPAVTQRIRQLEENLGFKLFHRINRGVELTPAGQSMLIDAEEILARTKSALERAQQIRRGQGSIRGKPAPFPRSGMSSYGTPMRRHVSRSALSFPPPGRQRV